MKLAFVYAVDVALNPNEFRLLAHMALTAIDDDPTPRYFDSREASAIALGRRIVDEGRGTDADKRARLAGLEAVKVAIRGLVQKGAIECIRSGKTGQRAEYRLWMDANRKPSKEGSPFRARKAQPSEQGRLTLLTSEGSAFPSGTTEGTTEEQTEGTTSSPSLNALAPVENFARAIG